MIFWYGLRTLKHSIYLSYLLNVNHRVILLYDVNRPWVYDRRGIEIVELSWSSEGKHVLIKRNKNNLFMYIKIIDT